MQAGGYHKRNQYHENRTYHVRFSWQSWRMVQRPQWLAAVRAALKRSRERRVAVVPLAELATRGAGAVIASPSSRRRGT